MATITASTTALSSVQTAINSAAPGDTVVIPNGSATWGASGAQLSVNKAITLTGESRAGVAIAISSTAASWSGGVIVVTANATVKTMTITGPAANVAAIHCDTANAWRITDITWTGGAAQQYFVFAASYGLIDHCTITGNTGDTEWIFNVGPSDSWQTDSSMGTANALYVEDCTFENLGYSDANNNARTVFRFCTFNGSQKVDGHGKRSNSLRGVRHMEVYNNTWTSQGYWTALEMRGGTGRVFNNVGPTNPDGDWFLLAEYYVIDLGYTSANYPIDDQIGVGKDPKTAASEPYYAWGNRRGSSVWQGSSTQVYGFDMTGVINADRDYFQEGSSFNGSSGVGIGTKAAMLAITPTKTGVGYWVTNEGSWRSGYAGTSGQLYIWNGSAWVLNYTPYTYPHPLQAGGGGGPTSGLSDYAENVALDALFGSGSPATYYLALFTAAPADSGGGTEVSGGSYARKSVTNNSTNFPASAAGSKTLNVAQTFAATSASWGTVTHWGIFTASSGGNLVAWGALTTARAVGAANTVTIPAASLALTLD